MSLVFDPTKVKAAARGAQHVQLDAVQERLVKDLADLVGPRIGLDPIPCRGLWLQAVRCWQMEHDLPSEVLSRYTPSQRRQAASEIAAHFARLAREMLSNPAQAAALDEALADAFRMYLEKYNRRSGGDRR